MRSVRVNKDPKMKKIEQTSLVLLAMTFVVAALVLGMIFLSDYLKHPPLFIEPPELQEYSAAKLLAESTDFDQLKKVCSIWAERDDENRTFLNDMNHRINKSLQDLAIGVLWFCVFVGAGLIYINVIARRMSRA